MASSISKTQPVFVVMVLTVVQLIDSSKVIAQSETDIYFVREFSTSGSESGLLDEPRSVAVDSEDRIVVTDSDRGSSADTNIHICDEWGECSGFGEAGSDIGQFSRAFGVAVDSRDRIVIADADNDRIQICNHLGECSAFGGKAFNAELGKFNFPDGVAIDSQDQVVVSDELNGRVQICNDEGSCTAFGRKGVNVGEFDNPRSLTVDNQDRIIVADSGNHRIQICNYQGECSAFGGQGVAPGQFNWPWDVAVDSLDRIFVTDEGNNRLQVCSYAGECKVLGGNGAEPGYFNSPRGIAVDSRDRIIVADLSNNRVQIFSTTNTFHINPGLNDAWYNPDTSGQGFFITVFPDLGAVSLAWFTYDTDLPPIGAVANLGDPGHRWLTAVGPIDGNQVTMNIELTSGGLFDTPTEISRTDPPGSDGTIVLTFDDCNTGTVEYDIPSINRQGIVPIQRVASDNVALCEALNAK